MKIIFLWEKRKEVVKVSSPPLSVLSEDSTIWNSHGLTFLPSFSNLRPNPLGL